jgi:chorismate mutase-like protein
MGQELSQLNDLRREIDTIDDTLHDLLIRRAEISRAIAKVKQPEAGEDGGSLAYAMRPAREAAILRRLLARHRGDLPPQVIVRIWREIIAASLRAQSTFELHVLAGTDFFDLARAYFGSLAPIRTYARPSLVVHACAENLNSIGLLSLPEFEEPGATWWAQLAPAGQPGPRVIAKLPFVVDGEDAPSAYAIGAIEQAPSGDDTTLLLLEIASGMSRTKLRSFIKDAGLDATLTATGRTSDKKVPDEILLAVKGFIAPGDERLKALMEIAGGTVARVAPIGGFANPVSLHASDRSQ